jgi:hypothetical protein
MTPYTTKTGVQIGIRYQPPKPGMYRDDELLQAALLGVKQPRVPKLVWLVIASVAAYLMAGCIARMI